MRKSDIYYALAGFYGEENVQESTPATADDGIDGFRTYQEFSIYSDIATMEHVTKTLRNRNFLPVGLHCNHPGDCCGCSFRMFTPDIYKIYDNNGLVQILTVDKWTYNV